MTADTTDMILSFQPMSKKSILPILKSARMTIAKTTSLFPVFLKNLNKGDTVYIHPEAEYHPSTTLQKIIDAGMIPGIAINPGTSVETVMEMLRIVDKVLVMSVNPGNAGQMYLPYVGQKVEKLIDYKKEMGFELFWDGACSADKIKTFAPKGVDGFVLGTTLLFDQKKDYGTIIKNIREMNI